MNNQVSYGRLLLYNFLIGLIGGVVALIVNLGFIINLFRKIGEQVALNSDDPNQFFVLLGYIIGYGGFILVLMFIITKLFTSGISYIPYLYKTNQLDLVNILKFGIKKFFPVVLTYIVAFLAVGVVIGILSIIPIVNFLTYVISPYLAGLVIFLVDYHLSRNALHGLGATANVDKNFVQLFKHTKSERGVFIVPIFYMLANIVGLGNLFIKPLIHLRIIAILEDEERLPHTPPPTGPTYYPPPQPPQHLG